jgi:hypothetical protein
MKRLVFVVVVAMVFFLPQGASSETPDQNLLPLQDSSDQAMVAFSSQEAASAKGDSFGLVEQYLHINATDFTPLDSPVCGIEYVTFHAYMLAGSCLNSYSMAPVNLPAGAWLDRLTCFTYDSDAVANTGWSLQRVQYPYPNGPPGFTVLASQTKDHSAGWSEVWTTVGETIHYRNPDAQYYYLRIDLDPDNSSIQFVGCRIYWNRQITPAPVTATFSDVPVGAFGFQHIEALVDSGITAGCGGGNFCPNDPLTRVQMAIFLAKALGLHEPD